MIKDIPKRNTIIHGDFHIKNIMHLDNENLLIDMETLSVGHPIFELVCSYCIYEGFECIDPKNPEKFLGIPQEQCRKFIDLTFKGIDNYKLFMEVVKPILEEDMIVVRTGKSISIRVNTKKLSFKESFEDNVEIIKTAFDNIERLICLVEKIDINKIRN